MRHRPRLALRYALLITALLAMVGMEGCGSSKSASSSTATSASAAPASGATNGSDSANVAKAQATWTKYSKLPTSIGYTEKLDGSVRGKNVYFPVPQDPTGAVVSAGLQNAANALGINFHAVNAGVDPQSFKAALQQIAHASPKPDAVVMTGIEPATVATELNQLRAQKIPVIASSAATTNPAVVGRGVQVSDWQKSGALSADYVYSQSKGKGQVLALSFANFPIVNQGSVKGFVDQYKQLCPACKVANLSIQAADIGTAAPGQIVSYIQRNPDTTWIFGGVGDLLLGVPEALKSAGLSDKVKAIAYSGTQTNYQYIETGDVETAVTGFANVESAWAMMNEAAEAMLGQPVQQPAQPQQVVLKNQINWPLSTGWPGAQNYEGQFKALWAASDK